MKYKKCPICEINYILENEEKCEVCKEKIMYDKNNIVNKGRKTNPIAEKFTFKNEKVFSGKLSYLYSGKQKHSPVKGIFERGLLQWENS